MKEEFHITVSSLPKVCLDSFTGTKVYVYILSKVDVEGVMVGAEARAPTWEGGAPDQLRCCPAGWASVSGVVCFLVSVPSERDTVCSCPADPGVNPSAMSTDGWETGFGNACLVWGETLLEVQPAPWPFKINLTSLGFLQKQLSLPGEHSWSQLRNNSLLCILILYDPLH